MDERRYAEAMRRLADRHRVDWLGRFLPVDREVFHYVAAGGGPQLLLLHGWAAWSYSWRKNIPSLSKYVKVYAPDLLGFGLSSKTRAAGYSLWDQAHHMLRFMDALGLERVMLGGHSMGGEIALRMATLAPERVAGLVLVASTGYWPVVLPRPVRLALRVPGLNHGLVRAAVVNARFARSTLSQAYGDPGRWTESDLRAYLLPARTPGATGTLIRFLQEMDFGAIAGRIRDLPHPALVVWGARDPWWPLAHGERLAQELGARLHVLPDAGHVPQEEYPDEFNRVALEWLAVQGYSGAER